MEGKKMVVTKIEAGEYSIVTASGLKFSAMKQRNHYWTVQNDSLVIIAGYPTLKECEEWAEKKDTTKEIEDLEKAQWYINREIKRLEGLEK